MECVKCSKRLSAGDITISLVKGKWVVMCPSCDTVQPFVVIEEPDGNGFIVAV